LPRASRHENLPAVTTSIWFWIAFHVGVFIALGIDLFSSKRRGRELSIRAAFRRTAIWVIVSLGFNALSGVSKDHITPSIFLQGISSSIR
jgi:hypothetical protein